MNTERRTLNLEIESFDEPLEVARKLRNGGQDIHP